MQHKENIPTLIYNNSFEASEKIAQIIAEAILEKQARNQIIVLGLATGSTPIAVYRHLIQWHKEKNLSFYNVHSFNLDEYFPMQPTDMQSYVRFMNENFFDHIDIPKNQTHIPDGTISKNEVERYCSEYEEKIEKLGGIDIQLLGIGRTGHVGFNEPGSSKFSKMRLIHLDQITKIDAASDFFGQENVPDRAITLGVGTIIKAKKIILMAWGEGKASIVAQTIEGSVSSQIPATFLQEHDNVQFYLDKASAALLTRELTPWILGEIEWTDEMIKKAVVWLSKKTKKPILKLTNTDYTANGMADLILGKENAYNLNIRIFNKLQHTITGWPGGKPLVDDSQRPERATPFPKRILIFSPHPDDDVISMGGTFIRLVDQGHEVHVAYQTSGNIAVFNEHVLQQLDFAYLLAKELDEHHGKMYEALLHEIKSEIKTKKVGEPDPVALRQIKGHIRKSEARAGCHYVGIPDSQIHFQDLPFYETGIVKKNPIGEADIKLTEDLINKIRPHQIFAAGDLSDPHGTHRVCLDAILAAIDRLKMTNFMQECRVWLYRGAWQEWPIDEIEMAVPLSPDELRRKRNAIFKHQSQKDAALFPGHDSREFWQRAEDRNRDTASQYQALGLASYEAIEAFRQYKFT